MSRIYMSKSKKNSFGQLFWWLLMVIVKVYKKSQVTVYLCTALFSSLFYSGGFGFDLSSSILCRTFHHKCVRTQVCIMSKSFHLNQMYLLYV